MFQVPSDAILCRVRLLATSELQSHKVFINRREHEQIMQMLMENEAALEKVRDLFLPSARFFLPLFHTYATRASAV